MQHTHDTTHCEGKRTVYNVSSIGTAAKDVHLLVAFTDFCDFVCSNEIVRHRMPQPSHHWLLWAYDACSFSMRHPVSLTRQLARSLSTTNSDKGACHVRPLWHNKREGNSSRLHGPAYGPVFPQQSVIGKRIGKGGRVSYVGAQKRRTDSHIYYRRQKKRECLSHLRSPDFAQCRRMVGYF
jgi:hypothetical protein